MPISANEKRNDLAAELKKIYMTSSENVPVLDPAFYLDESSEPGGVLKLFKDKTCEQVTDDDLESRLAYVEFMPPPLLSYYFPRIAEYGLRNPGNRLLERVLNSILPPKPDNRRAWATFKDLVACISPARRKLIRHVLYTIEQSPESFDHHEYRLAERCIKGGWYGEF